MMVRSSMPLPSPISGGETSAAISLTGKGMASARIFGHSAGRSTHWLLPPNKERDFGEVPLTANDTRSKVSLTRFSMISFGMERQYIQFKHSKRTHDGKRSASNNSKRREEGFIQPASKQAAAYGCDDHANDQNKA